MMYDQYLRTPEFKAVRSAVMNRADHKCERCGEPASEVHHVKYAKWGTIDDPENMIAICHQCHCSIHGKEN